MNRLNFAAWSLELPDEAYAPALAGLGVLAAARRRRKALVRERLASLPGLPAPDLPEFLSQLFLTLPQADGTLTWCFPSPPARNAVPETWPPAGSLAEAWRRFRDAAPAEVRLALSRQGAGLSPLLACYEVLKHPAVGAASVFVADMFASDGRVAWSWPFRLVTLPSDPLAEAFRAEEARLPPSWPYDFGVADREHAQAEILVLSGALWPALSRLRADRLHRRMALSLILGGVGEPWKTAEALVTALAAELSLEGLVFFDPAAWEGESPASVVPSLRGLADCLTHNMALDMALTAAFGPTATILANRDLLRLSHLSHTVEHLAVRLKKLPPTSELHLSMSSAHKLRLSDTLVESGRFSPEMTERGSISRELEPVIMAISPTLLGHTLDRAKASLEYRREGEEAQAVAELAQGVGEAEAKARQHAEPPRFIQHRLFRKAGGELVEEVRRLEVGVPVLLRVRIGPEDAGWQAAPEVFPEEFLPPQEEAHRLQVVFHEPEQLDQPLTGELLLPPSGPSDAAEFTFTPRRAAAFQGRITILYRGRVLQTALVETQVSEAGALEDPAQHITQRIEARVRGSLADLEARRPFDLALVLNHAPGGRPLLTAVSDRRAWARDLTGIEEPVRAINDELSNVALSVEDFDQNLFAPANEALFVRLARLGALLYARLFLDGLQASETPDLRLEEEEYIQVISTRPDAVVPLEFFYPYTPPKLAAKICPQALEALQGGACPPDCPRQTAPRDFVCPLGFWGLSKVIERHVYNPKLPLPDGAALTVQAEPLAHRDRLALGRGAVLGYSKEVPAAKAKTVETLLQTRFPDHAHLAQDWQAWHTAVQNDQPSLLVAFPHNEGSGEDIKLEIHDDFLETLRLPFEPDFVHVADAAFPLVMLLGCDTSGTAQEYASHVGNFRQAGAAAVISTIATVFGEHAVRVGEKFLRRLLDPERTEPSRLGELLRQVKREAVAESLPMALGVVAFGDADWRL
ncbi:MAG: hypothetical protein KQJ78_16655 [Deltaproteobacteria bacterium]|nr:hypothetical protein [Deltaproteobacteria bacterium]